MQVGQSVAKVRKPRTLRPDALSILQTSLCIFQSDCSGRGSATCWQWNWLLHFKVQVEMTRTV